MCSDCDIGKYQPLRATTSCLICQSGTYQISAGSYFCKSCGTGKYLNDAALTVGLHDQASDCKSCNNGKYLDDVGGDHEKYFIKTSGLCTDSGAGSVLSINECMAAASVLSLAIPVRTDGSDVLTASNEGTSSPRKCYFGTSGIGLKFNSQTSSNPACSSSRQCLCKKK